MYSRPKAPEFVGHANGLAQNGRGVFLASGGLVLRFPCG